MELSLPQLLLHVPLQRAQASAAGRRKWGLQPLPAPGQEAARGRP